MLTNLSDYHIHSSFSSDSDTSPRDIIEQAIALGLSNICFTDHNDYDFPPEDGKTMFLLDFDSYVNQIRSLREQYTDKIQICIGVEQGLQPYLADKINSYDSRHELDFIIGSTHLVEGKDPYYESFWTNRSPKETIIKYFENTYENICVCDNYDVYGHLDYIVRYAPGYADSYDPTVYKDIIDKILTKLIQKGKGIEINTAGIKYGLKETNPCLSILKQYRRLGGEIITIGSDAHKAEHLAYSFSILPDLLQAAGFNYYTIFKERTPIFIPL